VSSVCAHEGHRREWTARYTFSGLRHLPWLLVKDLVIAVIWLAGFFKRRVNWRGNVLWIGSESRLYTRPKEPGAFPRAARA